MKLSKNFDLSEFTTSQTASRLGINNTPNVLHIERLQRLCDNVLQPYRDLIDMPVIITSGYRCAELNRAIGSKETSQHIKAEAADFIVSGMNIQKAYRALIDNFVFDQAILEFDAWIHVSYISPASRPNRKQKLIAVKKNGQTIYAPYIDLEIK